MRILTMGIDSIDPEKFVPCINEIEGLNKPAFGSCLYGSTMIKFDSGCVSSEWGCFTQYDYEAKYYKNGISYKLNHNTKIAEVNSVSDYKRILNKYGTTDMIGRTCIDFYKLSKDFDAFHLTSKGIYDTGYGRIKDSPLHLANFYSYDAETWIMFNIDCINKGSILNHNNINYELDSAY